MVITSRLGPVDQVTPIQAFDGRLPLEHPGSPRPRETIYSTHVRQGPVTAMMTVVSQSSVKECALND